MCYNRHWGGFVGSVYERVLMEMSFSGSSTLFTSVQASPKSGPVQVSAILRILVCVILPFLQVLHIPYSVSFNFTLWDRPELVTGDRKSFRSTVP